MVVYLQMIETPEEQTKFEQLYLEYKGLMHHVANEILCDELDAEDAVHQAFVTIAENIKKIGDPISARTRSYVVTIAESRAIDAYRKKTRHKVVSFDDACAGLTVDHMVFDDTLARCMAKLKPRYREVMILKHRHGFSNKEIAKMLDLTEANAIKLEQRAKHKLFELCEEEGLL